MSTTHESGRGRLGPAQKETGVTRGLERGPSAEELDRRQARIRTRRRGPLGELRQDPDALRSLEDAEVPDTPPTECAEPPEEEDTPPEGGTFRG